MQAIETKFHGPTNNSGSRISARCEAARIILPWDHALDSEANHIAAARALMAKLGWEGKLYTGSVPSLPSSMVHVITRGE
jgi:hypothetical protein